MKKGIWVAGLLSIVVTVSLMVTAVPGLGQEPPPAPPKPGEQITDADKDKIFDNLEKRMAAAGREEPFRVIVLFTQPLSELSFPKLKKQLGSFNIKYEYSSINGIATTLTKGQIIAAAKHGLVRQVEYDGEVSIALDASTVWFGVQQARSDFSVTGNLDGSAAYSKDDIVVAVIDTGIDTGHVDLDSGKVLGGYDFVNDDTNPMDDNGHGTHVASIATGEGDGDSAYTGVASGAALVGVKVLDSKGNGTTADVDAGIQWVIDNKERNTGTLGGDAPDYGINIINISLRTPGSSDGTDSTSQLVNQAVAAGIVTLVAAGNEGPQKYTIGSPSAAADAITVGAMADVGENGFYQASFSSRGPTADERIKPDISAPGVAIMAARYPTPSGYIAYNGTSMSTPFTAGVAALMLAANQALTPAGIKTKLMNTAVDWGPSGTDIDYGAGRLDAYEAIKSAAGLSGTNITVPGHQYFAGSLSATGDADWLDINVTDASYPIAITLVIPDWVSPGVTPDFDIFLYAADGTTELASSEGVKRQETIGYQPGSTGTYRLKVYSYSGNGDYFFDRSSASPTVTSSDASGNEKNQFVPGEGVYVKGIWFEASTNYKVWIQGNPVSEGDAIVQGEDPSAVKGDDVTTDGSGSFGPTLIWSIAADAAVTYKEYDIVIDKLGNGVYNAADDGIDDATVAGITAPIPEASTLVLLMTGILGLFAILYLRRRRERLV